MPTTTIGTAASVWGLVMALAPLLQIARMVRRRSSRDLSVGYYIVQVEVDGMQLNLDPPTEAQKPWPTHSAGLYAELLPATTTVAALILILTLIPRRWPPDFSVAVVVLRPREAGRRRLCGGGALGCSRGHIVHIGRLGDRPHPGSSDEDVTDEQVVDEDADHAPDERADDGDPPVAVEPGTVTRTVGLAASSSH